MLHDAARATKNLICLSIKFNLIMLEHKLRFSKKNQKGEKIKILL
jgi:hypothetical protein